MTDKGFHEETVHQLDHFLWLSILELKTRTDGVQCTMQ